MPVPATNGQLRTRIEDMKIGDYIACNYKAHTSGVAGTFSNLGGPAGTEIPVTGSATPDGTFYFVKVARGLLIADRVVQHSISWNTLNSGGLIQGYEWKGGLYFNGTNSYVNIPYSTALTPTSAITCRIDLSLEDWTDPTVMMVMSKFQSGGYGFGINTTHTSTDLPNPGYIGFYVRAGVSYRGAGFNITDFEPNSKHSFVGTFDGRYIKLYVDGELKGVTDLGSSGNNIIYSYNNSLFFGCDVSFGSTPEPTLPYYFKGNIHLSAVWNRALTEQEVVGQNSTDVINYRNGLVGYWDFKQVFNNILYDLIGSNNGIINNCVYIEGDEKIVVRSLAGGVAYADDNGNSSTTDQGYGGWPTNNEWDKYIVNFPIDKIQAGKTLDDVFHVFENQNIPGTWCQDTPINGVVNSTGTSANSNYRTWRGRITEKRFNHSLSSFVGNQVGFRPVLEYKEV